MKTIKLSVGNDNGNSEQAIIISEYGKNNSILIRQPNVYSKVYKVPNLEEFNPNYMAKNIFDNLIITIKSNSINSGIPTTYYIGNYAVSSGNALRAIDVGVDNSKVNSDIPLVNTLGVIAGYVVNKTFPKDNNIKNINVIAEMATALPVNQYNKTNTSIFENKFNTEHMVIVHLGIESITININFDYVKVIPEGVTAVHYFQSLNENELNKIAKDYIKEYKEFPDFKNKRIFHTAIGEGTTEYPLTIDLGFDPNYISGTNNGIGHAINKILDDFKKEKMLGKFTRQEFSKVIQDTKHKYHDFAIEILDLPLETESWAIIDKVKQEITRANNDIDIHAVYGGGSILMKKYLERELLEFDKKADIKLLYIPEDYATIVEVKGLYAFCTSELFQSLKEIQKTNNQGGN